MTIDFVKMQGAGNDYIYIDCRINKIQLPASVIVRLCDRHFGVGADGVILIRAAAHAAGYMDMYNRDGTAGGICGNGLRCVAKYLYDQGGLSSAFCVDTPAGVKSVQMLFAGGMACGASIDMGQPIFDCEKIPVLHNGSCGNVKLTAGNLQFTATCLSMGNPHAVVFVKDPAMLDLKSLGPRIEHHAIFPQRVNAEFVCSAGGNELRARVWERGAGETLACGTGACAAAIAAILRGQCRRDFPVGVTLPGGRLEVLWRPDGGVTLSGDAIEVFRGSFELAAYTC